jgi:hypothetical protein
MAMTIGYAEQSEAHRSRMMRLLSLAHPIGAFSKYLNVRNRSTAAIRRPYNLRIFINCIIRQFFK